eukprot:TRINITY_DN2059_c0_g3_i1.p1 TRINITY_DN2059_c0_g3~~TRINITY_DN2059_c0_g3_i1.p1  ORF type:complete len:703 (+),score=132.40 TRINITY_DN2059_c0_g3_i1:1461-3569(+)
MLPVPRKLVQDSFEVCLIGGESVGKSALLQRLIDGTFDIEDIPTIEDSSTKILTVDNKECKLNIVDTGGSSSLSNLHAKWFSSPAGFVCVFNLTSKSSLQALEMMIHQLKQVRKDDYVIVLVGTHADRPEQELFDREAAHQVAYENNCLYFETSPKTGQNVMEVFTYLVQSLRAQKRDGELIEAFESPQTKKQRREKLPRKFDLREREQDYLSIVPDPSKRDEICEIIPVSKVADMRSKSEIFRISGPPLDESIQMFKEFACARSVSTYPRNLKTGVRDGDPICDQYSIVFYENRSVFALADGCNWGDKVKEAARKAVNEVINFMTSRQQQIRNTRHIAQLLLKAFLLAHYRILEGKTEETLFQTGTTTLLAGMMVELDPFEADGKHHRTSFNSANTKPKFACVFLSVGDCKAYLWKVKTGVVDCCAESNRQFVMDARDPGGRIGPNGTEGAPDLRNLTCSYVICEDGDIVSLVTDGIHDNFDPQQMGVLPRKLMSNLPVETWAELEKIKDDEIKKKIERCKENSSKEFINKLIGGSASLTLENRTTPFNIACRLTEHVLNLTKPSRSFMEDNPDKKLPADYLKYPGKLDHSTCVSFKIGVKRPESSRNLQKSNSDGQVPELTTRFWKSCTTKDGKKYFFNTLTRETTWEIPTFKNPHQLDRSKSLDANLFEEWKAYQDDNNGKVYYYNAKTKESRWELPTS